jgi:hypothetical protein
MVLQAALSNMDIEFIDGVAGKDVPDEAIPMAKAAARGRAQGRDARV